jgi:hypothetical protein
MNINQLGGQATTMLGTLGSPTQWRPITIPKKGERVVELDEKMHGVIVDIDGDQIIMKGDDHYTYKHHTSHYMKEEEYNAAHPGEQQTISPLNNFMIINVDKTYIFKAGKTKVDTRDDFEEINLNKMYLVRIINSSYSPNGVLFQVKFLYGDYKNRLTVQNSSIDFIRFKYINMLFNPAPPNIIRRFIVLLGDITNEININNFSLNGYRDIYNTLKQFIASKL